MSLRDVGLTFDGAAHAALKNVDLEIEPGRTVALVGAMGSGKTALVSLLPRLYEGPRVRSRIDGADVRSVDLQACARRSRSSPTIRSCSRPRSTTTSPTRAPTPRARRSSGRLRSLRPLGSSRSSEGLRHARRRARPDAVGWPAPADRDRPCGRSPIRGSSCSTTRPRRSTRRPSRRSSGRSATDGRADDVRDRAPSSTIALADEIVVLEHGEVAAHGTHDELLEESPLYREIVEKGMPDQVFMTRNAAEAVRTVSVINGHPPSRQAVGRPGPQAPRADRAARALQVARARDVHLARGRDRRRAGAGAAGEARDRPGDPEATTSARST